MRVTARKNSMPARVALWLLDMRRTYLVRGRARDGVRVWVRVRVRARVSAGQD